jgi:hypothetical protein
MFSPIGKSFFAGLSGQSSFLRIKDGGFKIDGYGTAVFAEMILFPDCRLVEEGLTYSDVMILLKWYKVLPR